MESLVEDQAQSQALLKCKRYCGYTMHRLNLVANNWNTSKDNLNIDAALRMHKRNIQSWDSLEDKAKNIWYSREDLIALHKLTNQQLDIIGRRLMLWNPTKWWTMSVNDSPKLEALTSQIKEKFGPFLPNLTLLPYTRFWTIDGAYCWTGFNEGSTLYSSRVSMWNQKRLA